MKQGNDSQKHTGCTIEDFIREKSGGFEAGQVKQQIVKQLSVHFTCCKENPQNKQHHRNASCQVVAGLKGYTTVYLYSFTYLIIGWSAIKGAVFQATF